MYQVRSVRSEHMIRRTAILLLGLFVIYQLFRMRDAERKLCELYPDPGNIGFVIKTGATEVPKLTSPLNTWLKCVRHVIILSDLEHKFQNHPVQDVLARISPRVIRGNPDFDIYRKQQELVPKNQDIDLNLSLARTSTISNSRSNKKQNPAWILDKYKFLHVLDLAYDTQPHRDWYFFVETDTYLSWPNFIHWIETLNSHITPYLAPSHKLEQSQHYFVQGGSGFLVSGAVAEEFASRNIGAQFEERAYNWSTGGELLSDMLYDKMGLQPTDATPLLIQYGIQEIPFSIDYWCQPCVAMRHMEPQDFEQLYLLESSLPSPLTFRDVYRLAYAHMFPSYKIEWDNMADRDEFALPVGLLPGFETSNEPIVINPHRSFENCRLACQHSRECFQFTFRNTTIASHAIGRTEFHFRHQCFLSRVFRLGHKKQAQSLDDKNNLNTFQAWESGWLPDRIHRWIEDNRVCYGGEGWSKEVMVDKTSAKKRIYNVTSSVES